MRRVPMDNIIRESLAAFCADIFRIGWQGKEREAVSLYAFGYLLRHCKPDTIFYDPAQIGIEVRVVPPAGSGKKSEICKDLVIWPAPAMTYRSPPTPGGNVPLAIMEWKANRASVFKDDVDWLHTFASNHVGFVGYALSLDLDQRDFRLSCTRVTGRGCTPQWLVVPGEEATKAS